MRLEIDVTNNLKSMERDLQKIKAAIPRITSRAVNELAVYARSVSIDVNADTLNLPRKAIAKGTRRGIEVDRFKVVKKSTALIPVAKLLGVLAGIQVTNVAGAWIGRKPGQGGGVKAKGGRFYRGAFKGQARGGTVRVFKRRGNTRKLFLPRIGINKALLYTFDAKISNGQGVSIFRQRFNRLAAFELAKAGIT